MDLRKGFTWTMGNLERKGILRKALGHGHGTKENERQQYLWGFATGYLLGVQKGE